MSDWLELKTYFPRPRPELKDVISSRLFEVGAHGVVEETHFVSGYFPASERVAVEKEWPAFLEELKERSELTEGLKWEWLPVPDVNWVEKYKETFKGQKLTHTFYLQPAWDKETQIPAQMIPIKMELGQAFGTGLHASTRLALRLLESVVGRFADPEKLTVMDVGTGTGILAIAAEKLGAGAITAIDIDEVSVEVARVNLKENESERITLGTEPLPQFRQEFDIVVANILLETHKQLQAHYRQVCKKNGYLILSGFLSYQLPLYKKWLQGQGWKTLEECHLQDWGALLLGRSF